MVKRDEEFANNRMEGVKNHDKEEDHINA